MRVVVNVAMSIDGKLSTTAREQIRLSGPEDTARVHRLRAECDAVLVGIETVLADNPSLTVRHTASSPAVDRFEGHPARVIADSRARTPLDADVLDDHAPSFVLVSERADAHRLGDLRATGAAILSVGTDRVDLPEALAALEHHDIESLLVEGGGELVFSILEAGLVSELTVFVAPVVLGGRDAPTMADGDGFLTDFPRFTLAGTEPLDSGIVLRFLPTTP